MDRIRIGTRASRLALWQAEFIASSLRRQYPTMAVEIVKIQTRGDKILDIPLAKIGGKGLFTQELELRMSAGEIDLAVHSLKDVPTELPAGFKLAAITKRAQPFDAFVSNNYQSLSELPSGAVIGTSSLRRSAQILNLRPDVKIENLRGNVDTRLRKLDAGNFDAIILAAVGLERLGYSARIRQILTEMIPAAGQGALAIEIRENDSDTADAVKFMNDVDTCAAIKVERQFLQAVNGSCQIPVGIFAEVVDAEVMARAVIASTDGRKLIRDSAVDSVKNIDNFGERFANTMLDNGGREILHEIGF